MIRDADRPSCAPDAEPKDRRPLSERKVAPGTAPARFAIEMPQVKWSVWDMLHCNDNHRHSVLRQRSGTAALTSTPASKNSQSGTGCNTCSRPGGRPADPGRREGRNDLRFRRRSKPVHLPGGDERTAAVVVAAVVRRVQVDRTISPDSKIRSSCPPSRSANGTPRVGERIESVGADRAPSTSHVCHMAAESHCP